jgi:glycosyltransferase involved in cell wall biosynthesis
MSVIATKVIPRTTEHLPAPVPVLLMVRELDQGGVERDVTKIALHLDRRRFLPYVATYCARGLRYEELASAGIPVLEIPVRSLFSNNAFRMAAELRRYILTHGIKIVHAYDASGIFGLAVAKMAGVPVAIGSQLSHRGLLDWKTRWLLRAADRYSDAIFVNCLALRRYLVEDERVPESKIRLCYNGALTREFLPGERVLLKELEGATLVVGTVCVLREEKNLPLLLSAFAKIQHLQSGLRLVIVGSGPELTKLRTKADQLGIAGVTAFISATPEVPRWLRAMDIFVLPSYSEAFSNALMEAMACGCAVIGSQVGGTPELIGSSGDRGLLFRSNDLDDLVDKLTQIVQARELRQRLGSNAAAHVAQHLTIEMAAETTAHIYDELLLKKSTQPRF